MLIKCWCWCWTLVRRIVRFGEPGNGAPAPVNGLRTTVISADFIGTDSTRMGHGMASSVRFRLESTPVASAAAATLLFFAVGLLLSAGWQPAIVRFAQWTPLQLSGRMHFSFSGCHHRRSSSASNKILSGITRWHLLRTSLYYRSQYFLDSAFCSLRPSRYCNHFFG